jgi:hypothetical protein
LELHVHPAAESRNHPAALAARKPLGGLTAVRNVVGAVFGAAGSEAANDGRGPGAAGFDLLVFAV